MLGSGAGGLCGCCGPGFLARGASPYRTGSPGSGKVAAKASTSIFSALSSFWYFSSSSFSLNSFSVALGLISFCTRSVSSIPAGWGTPGSALPAAAPAASSGSPTLQRLQKVWLAPAVARCPLPCPDVQPGQGFLACVLPPATGEGEAARLSPRLALCQRGGSPGGAVLSPTHPPARSLVSPVSPASPLWMY